MLCDPITIRRAEFRDAEGITDLWKEFMDFHQARDPIFSRSADGHQEFSVFIEQQMTFETSLVLVAERHGILVGYCLASYVKYPPIFKIKEYGSIVDLAVTRECRRQGVGESLAEAAQQWLRSLGLKRIEVRATLTNEVSTAFWRKMKFQPYVEILFREIP